MKTFGIYANGTDLVDTFEANSINDVDMDWTSYLDGNDTIEYTQLTAVSTLDGVETNWEIREI